MLSMLLSGLLEVQEEDKVRDEKEGKENGVVYRFESVVKDDEGRQGVKEVSDTCACTICANQLLWDRLHVANNS